MSKRQVDNSQDYLDIRDLIERFEELETERLDLADQLAEAIRDDDAAQNGAPDADFDNAKTVDAKREALAEWDTDDGDEFQTLKALLEELEGGGGGGHQWRGSWYPVTLIRDSYFVDAMQEFVQDIGDLPKNIPGYLAIDWDKTAENLRADYYSVEFGDVTYWYR